MVNIKFLKKEFTKYKNERKRKVALGDDVLYQMCKDYPNHDKYAWVKAKVGIIGRAYQTFIERLIKISHKGKKLNAMDQLVAFVISHHVTIDREIKNIRKLEK